MNGAHDDILADIYPEIEIGDGFRVVLGEVFYFSMGVSACYPTSARF